MRQRRTPLQIAQDRRQVAQAKAEAIIAERRLSRLQIVAKYDATDSGHSKKRRQSSIEYGGEEFVLPSHERLQGMALARDLHRNFSPARALLHQFAVNVVGTEGAALFHSPDEDWNAAAAEWFNARWAKECDARQDLTLSDMYALAVITRKRDGAVLCVFDDFETDDGRLLWYEADQLVTVDKLDWARQTAWTERVIGPTGEQQTVPLQQQDGVVFNRRGRVLAYVVSPLHGRQVQKLSEVTIIPATSARLWKTNFRFNQLAGVSELLTAAADMQDIYEMRAMELQSAKRAARDTYIVKSTDGLENALVAGGVDVPAMLDATTDPQKQTSERRNYEKLEALSGGATEFIDPCDEVTQLENKRPSAQIEPFFQFVQTGAGWGMGVAGFYASGRATASYTAFRGEMLSTWQTFALEQRQLERGLADWIVRKAVEWATSHGALPAGPSGWQYKISHVWPRMPEINQDAETNAKAKKLKNGLTTYQQELGENWQRHFQQLAKEAAVAEQLELPLALFETVSGALVEEAEANAEAAKKEAGTTEGRTNE